jgi:dephospho-CoA kinase
MLRVGLTGGLGSGKSTAARLFRELGVYGIQADEMGRALMQPGQPVYAELVSHFGPDIVKPDGALNRQALADLAFRQARLHELNKIVHPPVIAAQEEWMRAILAEDDQAIAMVESALIFEADAAGTVPGWKQRFDRIILVTAPDEEKIARYVARAAGPAQVDAQSLAEEARVRLAAQIPDDKKAALADFVIDNSGPLAYMQSAVTEVYSKLRAEATQRDWT